MWSVTKRKSCLKINESAISFYKICFIQQVEQVGKMSYNCYATGD